MDMEHRGRACRSLAAHRADAWLCRAARGLGRPSRRRRAAAGASAPASPRRRRSLYKLGITQDYDGINPFSSLERHRPGTCFRLSYDFLTWYDKDYQPDPRPRHELGDLAGRQGRGPSRIREGMTWQRRRAAHGRATSPSPTTSSSRPQHWAYIQYLTGVTKVEAPDDTTLVITCDKPNAGMLALYIPILPEHVWKKADPDETWRASRTRRSSAPAPSSVTEAKKSKWVKLEPNPDYPEELGGAAEDRRVLLRHLARTSTRWSRTTRPATSTPSSTGRPPTTRTSRTQPGTTAVAVAGHRLPRARLQLLERAQVQGQPAAPRRRHPPGRPLGHRQAVDRRHVDGRPAPSPAPR